MKTCLIVDDEESARQLLKEYLSYYKTITPIGEASDGEMAVQMINELKPDIVFLDIQMPVLNGFEVLEKIQIYPTIIFSTAYDEYAIKAFEVHAVDYLLKPYTKLRFDKAMERIKDKASFDKQMQLIDKHLSKVSEYSDSILVERSKRFYNIKLEEVVKIEAYGEYSKIKTKETSYLSKKGLSEVERKLNPKLFIRIHRSTIINQKAIVSLSKLGKGYLVLLTDDSEMKVSRGYAKDVKDMIL
jgi:two-component system LytT family response regulator